LLWASYCILHENSYKREDKEIQIGSIKIDFIGKDGVVHEVKKTPSVEKAHLWQVKYYLWYLKNLGVKNVRGEIDYPKLKKCKEVELTIDDEQELVKILESIENIVEDEVIPAVIDKPLCKRCSYYELCYI